MGNDTAPVAVRWLAVIAGMLAIIATYWDGAWHTEIGRDSTFAPPHLLLYASIVVVAGIVAAWALSTMIGARSVFAVLRQRALVLSGVALIAVAASAGLDVLWHEYFGRDAVLWSPPHLLGIIGSLVLVIGVTMSGGGRRAPRAIDLALGAVLLGTAMLPVMEYDSRVPQFSEVLYLPIVIVAALFAAWVIDATVSGSRVMTVIVIAVVAFRTVIWGVLTAWEWPAVDVPFALLGLALLDLPLRRRTDRVALAAAAMSAIQLAASAAGLSSVGADSVLPVALIVVVVAGLAMLIARRTGAVPAAVVVVALVAASLSVDAAPARAHDPGQGTDRGEIDMRVEQTGSRVAITVEPVASSVPIEFERIVARRAGQVIEATLGQRAAGSSVIEASVELAGGDLWFIYAEFSSPAGALESWITTEPGQTRSGVRPLYEPPVSPVNDIEFLGASAALYLLAAALIGFAVRMVARSRTARITPAVSRKGG